MLNKTHKRVTVVDEVAHESHQSEASSSEQHLRSTCVGFGVRSCTEHQNEVNVKPEEQRWLANAFFCRSFSFQRVQVLE